MVAGEEVAVSHIHFCSLSNIENFSLATPLNLSFSRHLKERGSKWTLHRQTVPAKRLRKILICIYMIRTAHPCVQSCTTRTRVQTSRYKYKRNASYCWLFSTSIFAFLPRLTIFLWPILKTCQTFPAKRLRKKFIIKYATKRACVSAKLYHKDGISKLLLKSQK